MYRTVRILLLILCLAFIVNGQNRALLQEALMPNSDDISAAEKQGLQVFKIVPRGMFDYTNNELSLRGGGAYYSFAEKSHSYDRIPQIQLQKENLSVAFYGANYGFITDLGKVSLSDVSLESDKFLANYKAVNDEATARDEYRKASNGFEIDGVKYNTTIAAHVGHVYILRAISFREADTLVAFQIHRKETDGSLVVFWKLLQNFETPRLNKTVQTVASQNKCQESAVVSLELAQKIQNALSQKGFNGVTVDFLTVPLTLRGTIPKGKMAEVVMIALEISGKPVKNELTEQ